MDEPDGFTAFVAGSSRELLRAGWLLTGDWATAQDLVQTALAKTWPRFERVDPDKRVAYIRRVMTTTFLSWRSRRWTGERPREVLPETPDGTDLYAAADLHESLRSALDVLPPRQRTVVVLRYFLDLTESATAAAMGCSVGTVKTQHARALAALRAVPGLVAIKDGS